LEHLCKCCFIHTPSIYQYWIRCCSCTKSLYTGNFWKYITSRLSVRAGKLNNRRKI